MSRKPPKSHRGSDGSGDHVRLQTLARALADYLSETDACYRTCLAHDPLTAVYTTAGDVRLVRLFPVTDAGVATVRDSLARLPSWRQSPFWPAGRTRWEEWERPPKGRAAGEGQLSLLRGVSWEGRPILVTAATQTCSSLLKVELLLPDVLRELPELPLRRIAHGLSCHAYLLSDRVAEPLPLAAHPSSAETVLGFLKRTMPPNLYAGHCIFGHSEGH